MNRNHFPNLPVTWETTLFERFFEEYTPNKRGNNYEPFSNFKFILSNPDEEESLSFDIIEVHRQ